MFRQDVLVEVDFQFRLRLALDELSIVRVTSDFQGKQALP